MHLGAWQTILPSPARNRLGCREAGPSFLPPPFTLGRREEGGKSCSSLRHCSPGWDSRNICLESGGSPLKPHAGKAEPPSAPALAAKGSCAPWEPGCRAAPCPLLPPWPRASLSLPQAQGCGEPRQPGHELAPPGPLDLMENSVSQVWPHPAGVGPGVPTPETRPCRL